MVARATRSIMPMRGRPDIQIRFVNRGSRPVTITHVGFAVLGQRYSSFQGVVAPQGVLSDGQFCTLSFKSCDFTKPLLKMLSDDKISLPENETAWQVEGVFMISINEEKHFKVRLDAQVSKIIKSALKPCSVI